MKRLTAIVLLCLILVVGLAACGNSSNGGAQAGDGGKGKTTVTMGFWGTAQDLKTYQEMAAAISEKYPDITLKIKQYPSSEQFWNTLPGEIAAGVAPDFIKLTNEGAFEYINKGLFAPLDELLGPAGVDMSRFTPSAVNIWKKKTVNNTRFRISICLLCSLLTKKCGKKSRPRRLSENLGRSGSGRQEIEDQRCGRNHDQH